MNETKIKNKVTEFLKKIPNCYFFKAAPNSFGMRGVPDFIICYRGFFIGAELKDKGNVPTPLQRYNIKKIKEAGGLASACYTVEDVKNILKIIDKKLDKES